MDTRSRTEWRNGWPLVVASLTGISTVTLVSYISGLVITPLEQEFGWSRTEITSGLLMNAAIGVIFAPFAGILIDRMGPRRVGLPGLIVFCVSFAALGTVSSNIVHWWALWLGVAVGALMLKPTVWTTAVSSRFDHARGTALAIMLLGTGITGMLAPALGGYFLVELGWRWTFIGLALCWGLVAFPLCFFFLYGAKDIARTRGAAVAAESNRVNELPGMDGREAFLSFKYFRLALSIALVMMVVSGTLVHLIPFYIDSGMDPLTAATLVSVIGLTNMIGRLTTGFLLDRFSGSLVGSVAFLLPAALMVLLLNFDGSIAMAIACAALLGLSAGAELDVAAYLTSRHFGMKSYGFLFGTIAGIMSLAMGVGPLLLSAVFDRAGAYDLAFKLAIPMAVLAAILVGSLGRYDPRFAPAAR